MEITVGMDEDVVILDLAGDLVANTAEKLKGEIARLSEKNFNFILINMSKVNFMDSSGLGACMAAHKAVAEKNGMIVFAQPRESVSKIFHITRADQKLAVAASRADGLRLIHEKRIGAMRK